MPFTTSSQIREFDELIYRVVRDYCHSTPQCEECPLKQLLDTQGPRSQRKQEDDDLSTKPCVDYTRLQDFLKAEQWQEADRETLAVMLKAAKREEQGWLNIESIEKISCTDFRTIDELWVNYSNGRFGFSVQKRIWESVGGKPDADEETWQAWGECVGWYVDGEWCKHLKFDQNAPSGELPKLPMRNYPRNTKQNIRFRSTIFSRVSACQA